MIEDNTFTFQLGQRDYQINIPHDVVIREGWIDRTDDRAQLILYLANGETVIVPLDELTYKREYTSVYTHHTPDYYHAPDIDDNFEVSEEDYMLVLSG